MPLEGPNWSPGPVSTCVQQVPVSSPAMILNHKSRTRADALERRASIRMHKGRSNLLNLRIVLSVSGLFFVRTFRRAIPPATG